MLIEILTHGGIAALAVGAVVLYRRTLGRPKHVRAHRRYKRLARKREALTLEINKAKADALNRGDA
jgi:hypothetical protein